MFTVVNMWNTNLILVLLTIVLFYMSTTCKPTFATMYEHRHIFKKGISLINTDIEAKNCSVSCITTDAVFELKN